MRRVTVSLPDELIVAMKREARRRALSLSAVAREALTIQLRLDSSERRQLPFVGIGRSGHHDTSEHVDAILDDIWNHRDLR